MTRILLLAGTREARELAQALAKISGTEVIASFAGATQVPAELPCETRVGGFGGADGLAGWLKVQNIDLLIDATHPFAEVMQSNALNAAQMANLPRLRLLRPAWQVRPGWEVFPNICAAAAALPKGASVLLTTGRKEIAPFVARSDCKMVVRTIEPVEALPPHIRPFLARPPFTQAAERAVFEQHTITHLVTKNSGGSGTAKLEVAEAMRIAVKMVDRPPRPSGPIVETVEAAVGWIRQSVGF